MAWALPRVAPHRTGRVLVPAYICSSVPASIEAGGYTPVFYRASLELEPDPSEIERLLKDGADAVLVVHYFGLAAPGFGTLRDLAREYEAALLEDCAHALFSRDGSTLLGSEGDVAAFGFRKTTAVPEGGVAVLPGRDVTPRRRFARSELAVLGREIAFRLDDEFAQRSGWSLRARIAKGDRLQGAYERASDERAVRENEPISSISRAVGCPDRSWLDHC